LEKKGIEIFRQLVVFITQLLRQLSSLSQKW